MDDFVAFIFLGSILGLAGIGITYLVQDVRSFNIIEKQCEERGYIQNNDVRIICIVEGKK